MYQQLEKRAIDQRQADRSKKNMQMKTQPNGKAFTTSFEKGKPILNRSIPYSLGGQSEKPDQRSVEPQIMQRVLRVGGAFNHEYNNLREAETAGSDVGGANAGQAQTLNTRMANFFYGQFGHEQTYNLMNAHMIARKFGGDGANSNNVKVWNRLFERRWTNLEEQAHGIFRGALNYPENYEEFLNLRHEDQNPENEIVTYRVEPIIGTADWWNQASTEMNRRYQNGPGANREWSNGTQLNRWQQLENLVYRNIPAGVIMEVATSNQAIVRDFSEDQLFPEPTLKPINAMTNELEPEDGNALGFLDSDSSD